MTTLEQKITQAIETNLPVEISKNNGITCHVEKVANSNKVRFVRTFANGSFVVFKTA